MLHRHHKIPKHAGGTDDPSNIVELTIEEHADAHRKLYEQYGRWQDYLAWKGLTGEISEAETIKTKLRLGQLGRSKSSEERAKISKNNGMRRPEIAIKTALKMRGNKNSVGHPNGRANKGKIWATNGIINLRLSPNSTIPEGFRRGCTHFT